MEPEDVAKVFGSCDFFAWGEIRGALGVGTNKDSQRMALRVVPDFA